MRRRCGLQMPRAPFSSTDEGTSWRRPCIEIRAAPMRGTLFTRILTRGLSLEVLFVSRSSPPPPQPRLVVEILSSLLPTGVSSLPPSPIRSPKPSFPLNPPPMAGGAEAPPAPPKKQRRGIVARLWWWIFGGRSEDYEKRLQHLSKEEAAVHARMKRRAQSSRRMIRNLIVFSVILEVTFRCPSSVVMNRSDGFSSSCWGLRILVKRYSREIQPIGSSSSHLGNSSLMRVYPFFFSVVELRAYVVDVVGLDRNEIVGIDKWGTATIGSGGRQRQQEAEKAEGEGSGCGRRGLWLGLQLLRRKAVAVSRGSRKQRRRGRGSRGAAGKEDAVARIAGAAGQRRREQKRQRWIRRQVGSARQKERSRLRLAEEEGRGQRQSLAVGSGDRWWGGEEEGAMVVAACVVAQRRNKG
ncbi:hypothetical protein GW17_00055276 [Ensete ventricosum]|nr:hypothetical protein GW17_00055276 [Ensete ventricosum]